METKHEKHSQAGRNVGFIPRERQCLAHVVEGKDLVEVGEELDISATTVHFYLRNARRKIDLLLNGER